MDLLEPNRLADRLRRNPALGATLFTSQERKYCSAQRCPEQHLAARFCAKEAVIKALGIDGWDPLDIEIIDGGPDVHVQLHGEVEAIAAALGVTVTVSMTHLASVAGAVAFARPAEGASSNRRDRGISGQLALLMCYATNSCPKLKQKVAIWRQGRVGQDRGDAGPLHGGDRAGQH